jgi:Flp pilus assembly protein TadD
MKTPTERGNLLRDPVTQHAGRDAGRELWWKRPAVVAAMLTCAAIVIYLPATANDFIREYDDAPYVLENPAVLGGLSVSGIVYAFTQRCGANWHPITMLSHMADVTLFGTNPAGHHFTSVLIHGINVALFYLFLVRATGNSGRSAAAAVLFAFHPVHVQSVAAVFQRKDVLSTFFLLLALIAYVGYVRTRSPRRFGLVLLSAALGLMSKSMLVTLPFLLVLVDIWPLKRIDLAEKRPIGAVTVLVREKWPLFLLTAIFCVITVIAQGQGGAIAGLEQHSLKSRVGNAIVSYATYLRILVWPADLAIHYPYPKQISPAIVAASLALLVAISVAAFALRKRCPYFLAGWLWYLGAMVPVIGIVQVGMQAMADRYAYIPFLGLYMVIVWGAADLFRSRKLTDLAGPVLAGVSALTLAAITSFQIPQWRNDVTLWEHALAATEENETAHSQLATIYSSRKDPEKAVFHAKEAARIAPTPFLLMDLGDILVGNGNAAEAEQAYRRALDVQPGAPAILPKLGKILVEQRRTDEAETLFKSVTPPNPVAEVTFGRIYLEQNILDAAERHFRKAIELDSRSVEGNLGLGTTLERQGKREEAIAAYSRALELYPDQPTVRAHLEKLRSKA